MNKDELQRNSSKYSCLTTTSIFLANSNRKHDTTAAGATQSCSQGQTRPFFLLFPSKKQLCIVYTAEPVVPIPQIQEVERRRRSTDHRRSLRISDNDGVSPKA